MENFDIMELEDIEKENDIKDLKFWFSSGLWNCRQPSTFYLLANSSTSPMQDPQTFSVDTFLTVLQFTFQVLEIPYAQIQFNGVAPIVNSVILSASGNMRVEYVN